MTDPDENRSDKAESVTDDVADGAGLMQHDHPIVRLTRWQTVLSVISIFIALIALYAALSESAAVRQQTAASVWPLLQLSVQDSDDGSEARITMSVTNAGVGPARIQSFRLQIEGNVVSSWADAVERLDGEITSRVSRNFIVGRVVRADETVTLFSTVDTSLARRFRQAVVHPQSMVTFCYCSIFDDCWLVADSNQQKDAPEEIATCPDFGADAFQN